MPARPSVVLLATIALLTMLAGCEAKVYGASAGRSSQPRITVIAPMGTTVDAPQAPPGTMPTAAFDGLAARIQQATREAAADGATISVAVLDRATGELVSNGNNHGIATASVAKLFIADDLLMRESQGLVELSAQDRAALDLMLQSSDDNAAETFWAQGGGDAIIPRVAKRYALSSTTPGSDGRWWNVMSTAAELVGYYDKLLDGSGGLPPERANIIVGDLARSTATGVDGYSQRFGIPDGLPGEQVAVKQGWMCCIGSDWMHLSSGVIGADRRYVMVIESLQTSDDATARATITRAVRTMFPDGLT